MDPISAEIFMIVGMQCQCEASHQGLTIGVVVKLENKVGAQDFQTKQKSNWWMDLQISV